MYITCETCDSKEPKVTPHFLSVHSLNTNKKLQPLKKNWIRNFNYAPHFWAIDFSLPQLLAVKLPDLHRNLLNKN